MNPEILKEYIEATAAWYARAAILESKGISPRYPTSERDRELRLRYFAAKTAYDNETQQ